LVSNASARKTNSKEWKRDAISGPNCTTIIEAQGTGTHMAYVGMGGVGVAEFVWEVGRVCATA
jgi:hypothetical protein